jgi:hypothetical protein
VGVLEPEATHGRAEQRVVVPGHVVDAAEAADAVVVGRGGAPPEGEDGRQAPRRWVPSVFICFYLRILVRSKSKLANNISNTKFVSLNLL